MGVEERAHLSQQHFSLKFCANDCERTVDEEKINRSFKTENRSEQHLNTPFKANTWELHTGDENKQNDHHRYSCTKKPNSRGAMTQVSSLFQHSVNSP